MGKKEQMRVRIKNNLIRKITQLTDSYETKFLRNSSTPDLERILQEQVAVKNILIAEITGITDRDENTFANSSIQTLKQEIKTVKQCRLPRYWQSAVMDNGRMLYYTGHPRETETLQPPTVDDSGNEVPETASPWSATWILPPACKNEYCNQAQRKRIPKSIRNLLQK